MWDARFEGIRDRKLNELVIFSAMVRTDMARRQEYLQIINQIATDLDVIEALVEERPVPESKPISSELYRSRLSKMELLDEYCLDACRSAGGSTKPEQPAPEMEAPAKEGALEEPDKVDSIKAPEKSPRLEPSEPKPSIEAPEEIHRIGSSDPVQSIEAPERPQGIPAPEAVQRLEPSDPVQSLDSPDKVDSIEAPEAQQSIPALETLKSIPSGCDIPDDVGGEGPTEQDPDDVTFDLIISIQDAVTLKKVRMMKDRKIDYFIDAEMEGRFKDEACEDVISFLKVDLKLIDTILSVDFTSKRDIEEKIRAIVKLVQGAEEPRHRKLYYNALNRSEKDLESEYHAVLQGLENVMTSRYSHLMVESERWSFRWALSEPPRSIIYMESGHRAMEEQPKVKMSKHVCACGPILTSVSANPLLDIISVLDDADALTILKGLMKKEVRSPFPDGLYGMDAPRTNKALRSLLRAGLVNSRVEGPDHIYYIHVERFRELKEFVDGCVGNKAEKA